MHGLDLKDKHIILAGSTRYLIQTRVSRGRRRGTSTSPSMMCAIINLKQPNLLPERKLFEWMWKWTSANPNLRAHSHARCPAGGPDVARRRPGPPAGCGRTRARPSRGTARVAAVRRATARKPVARTALGRQPPRWGVRLLPLASLGGGRGPSRTSRRAALSDAAAAAGRRGRPSAAGEAISGRGEWKAGWRLARFVWPGALLTFSAVGLDFSVHFHSTGAEEAGPGAGRGCCARMEICKDEEEVRACIKEGRKFQLDPSVTELDLRSVSRWSSLLILCSSSHRVHLGMVFDIFS